MNKLIEKHTFSDFDEYMKEQIKEGYISEMGHL